MIEKKFHFMFECPLFIENYKIQYSDSDCYEHQKDFKLQQLIKSAIEKQVINYQFTFIKHLLSYFKKRYNVFDSF